MWTHQPLVSLVFEQQERGSEQKYNEDMNLYHDLCQVAVRCLETAVQGARYNVLINLEVSDDGSRVKTVEKIIFLILKGIEDEKFRAETIAKIDKELEVAILNRDKILAIVEKRK